MATSARVLAQDPILLTGVNAGIATLTLNRPRQYNALSEDMLIALQDALDDIAGDDTVRVVVIAANGKAFCAGHDLKEMRSSEDRAFHQALFDRCGTMMQTINKLPQPVIAKVQGIATAAGCQLVAQCDLAVAAETARFAVSGINVGLFCSTPAVPLSRNMQRKQAMQMLLTGDFINAADRQSSSAWLTMVVSCGRTGYGRHIHGGQNRGQIRIGRQPGQENVLSAVEHGFERSL